MGGHPGIPERRFLDAFATDIHGIFRNSRCPPQTDVQHQLPVVRFLRVDTVKVVQPTPFAYAIDATLPDGRTDMRCSFDNPGIRSLAWIMSVMFTSHSFGDSPTKIVRPYCVDT